MAGISNSIVIVNFNSKAALLALLHSLQIDEATNSEVIVVDNASFDGSVEAASEQFPRAKVVTMPSNRGFAAAANVGIDQAQGAIVVVCHSDVIADVHTLADLADQAREAEGRKVAAVVPRLVGVDGQPQAMVGRQPGLMRCLAGVFNPTLMLKTRIPVLDHLADGDWARFVCVALNVEHLTLTGGFDEEYFLYCADADLCARIERKQLRVLISKSVTVKHGGSELGKQTPAHLLRLLSKDQRHYRNKYLSSWQQKIVSLVATVRGWVIKAD